jgi:hypothetical protein
MRTGDDVTASSVKQYVRYNKRGTKQVMKAIHSVHREDLTDLNDDDLFRVHDARDANSASTGEELRRSKQQVLSVLREAGIAEVDDATVQLLPTWDELTALYGKLAPDEPLHLGGTDTCSRFRALVPTEEAFLGTAGLFNSGTNAMTYYLRANLRMASSTQSLPRSQRPQHHHDGILTQVPWDKHYFVSLKDKHTVPNAQSIDKGKVLPIVTIRDPLTWWHSMCTTPYSVKFDQSVHENGTGSTGPDNPLCRHLASTSDATDIGEDVVYHSVSMPSMTGSQSWATILHLWNDWYRAYLSEYKDPFLMVRFEDLLFRPKAVLRAIQECVNASWIDETAFTYVVDHSKWEHVRFHGPQSTMISAMIKHGNAARRVQGLTNHDLQLAQQILDPTLLRQFGYHVPTSVNIPAAAAKEHI